MRRMNRMVRLMDRERRKEGKLLEEERAKMKKMINKRMSIKEGKRERSRRRLKE